MSDYTLGEKLQNCTVGFSHCGHLYSGKLDFFLEYWIQSLVLGPNLKNLSRCSKMVGLTQNCIQCFKI